MPSRLRFFLGLIVGIAGFATVAEGQTLEEALASAYGNNPTLAAQRARVRAVDEGVPQALSNWRPSVIMSGSAGTAYNRRFRGSGDQRQNQDPKSAGVTIEQSLYRGGRTIAATRKAVNEVQAERARLLTTEQEVLLDAATAFMDVVRDQAVLELTINNEQVLRRQLEATEDRFRVGEVTRTDVFQAQARLAGASAERIQAEGNLEISRATYKNVVGEAPKTLTAPENPGDLPADVVEAVTLATSNNPSVKAAEFDERASLDNAEEVRGELLPSVSLEGSVDRDEETSSEDSSSATYAAGISVSVPLYQQGAVYSRLREARQVVAEDRKKIDESRRNAVEAATQSWETLQAARSQIDAFQSQVKANEIALEGVQRESEVGSRTILDVLNAEQELLLSKVNLVQAQRDVTVAIFDLKNAIGQLTAEEMNLAVDYYDPDKHYLEVRDKWFGGTSAGDATTVEPTEGSVK